MGRVLVKRPFAQPLDPVKLAGLAKSNAPNVSTVMWPGSYLVKLVGLAVVKRPTPENFPPLRLVGRVLVKRPYLSASQPTVNSQPLSGTARAWKRRILYGSSIIKDGNSA